MHARFSLDDIPDVNWIIPDTGEVTVVTSAKDGATAGEIRQILSERDVNS